MALDDRHPRPEDQLLAALVPLRHLVDELLESVERMTLRRERGWPTLLVATQFDDAVRLHQAIGASLERLNRTIVPEVRTALGLTKPIAPQSIGKPVEGAEGTA